MAQNVVHSIDDRCQIERSTLDSDLMALYQNQFATNAIHRILIQECSKFLKIK